MIHDQGDPTTAEKTMCKGQTKGVHPEPLAGYSKLLHYREKKKSHKEHLHSGACPVSDDCNPGTY